MKALNPLVDTSHSVKLEDRWLGPYRIREVSEVGYYRLNELDGVELKESFAGNRLKKFFVRDELEHDRQILEEYQRNREAAIRERQAQSANPARLQELREMIDAAGTAQAAPAA